MCMCRCFVVSKVAWARQGWISIYPSQLRRGAIIRGADAIQGRAYYNTHNLIQYRIYHITAIWQRLLMRVDTMR